MVKLKLQTYAVNVYRQRQQLKLTQNEEYLTAYAKQLQNLGNSLLWKCLRKGMLDIWLIEFYYPKIVMPYKKWVYPLMQRIRKPRLEE